MKKIHYPSLKFHTIYSVVLAFCFFFVLVLVPDWTLVVAMTFLFLYIIGNGIIHAKNNQLKRDTLIEYVLVAIIVLVLLVSVR